MSKETNQNPQPFLDRPDRKLLLVGRGLGLGRRIGGEALELSGAEKPKVLVIASPADTPQSYEKYTTQPAEIFGKQLGASVDNLHGFMQDPSPDEVDDKIGNADVIWISGGRTSQAIKTFKRTGIDKAILNSRGKVISGGSAGTLLQADSGFSWDTPVDEPEKNEFIEVHGLPMVNATVNVHSDYIERDDGLTLPRSHFFVPFLKNNLHLPSRGIGIDDAAALAFSGESYRILTAEDATQGVGVTMYDRQPDGQVIQAHFGPTQDYAPTHNLRPTA